MMIAEGKQRHALHALNAVLVQARAMAMEEASHADIAYVLDCAEYLPMLMLEEQDRTTEFRQAVAGIANKLPAFAWALQRFDGM